MSLGIGNSKEPFGRSSVLTHDLTSGRCQVFISRSKASCTWFNTLKMNVLVHRFMFMD